MNIGDLVVDPPVVLAPMAGVTNSPFRRLCREYGGGLYVSEMVGARAITEGNEKTLQIAKFSDEEEVRSIQLYGVDPVAMEEAARRLVDGGRVEHIDLNFGCPAPKITRHGGGAALPFKHRLFEAVVKGAVKGAAGIPVTVKMRMGIDDDHLTYLAAGRSAEAAGAAAVALHARTARQLYSGNARWEAISELKQAITSIPVLGNGDIWEAQDAIDMMHQTGCDGVVVGRGCLGRPWLFRELEEALTGRPITPPPDLGGVAAVMRHHAEMLVEWYGEHVGIRSFRKHPSWYLKGFRAGKDLRRRLHMTETLSHLDDMLAELDPSQSFPAEAATMPRGHTAGPRDVRLPHNYLDDPDEIPVLDQRARAAVSGG
jgi:nifR3 family TIM-barrel protein